MTELLLLTGVLYVIYGMLKFQGTLRKSVAISRALAVVIVALGIATSIKAALDLSARSLSEPMSAKIEHQKV